MISRCSLLTCYLIYYNIQKNKKIASALSGKKDYAINILFILIWSDVANKKFNSAEKREIMPFINSKVSVAMSKEKKDSVKAKLGEVISLIPGKSEGWLMVGFEDSYDLYFKGNQDGPTVFVEVKVYGSASPDVFSRLTGAICDIYQEELGIPKDRIYVKYEEVENWGWNGSNF